MRSGIITFSGGSEFREQIVRLPNEANPVIAEIRECGLVECGDILAGDFDAALRRPVEAADQVEQRAFARAGLTDQRQALPLGHFERQILEHDHVDRAGLVPFGKVRREDGRCGQGYGDCSGSGQPRSSMAIEVRGGRNERYVLKCTERKKVPVAGDDEVASPINGCLQDYVVLRIATGMNRVFCRNTLGHAAEESYELLSIRDRDVRIELTPRENGGKFCKRSRGHE